jgi:hypothetical protein
MAADNGNAQLMGDPIVNGPCRSRRIACQMARQGMIVVLRHSSLVCPGTMSVKSAPHQINLYEKNSQ